MEYRKKEKKLIVVAFLFSELKAKRQYIARIAPQLDVKSAILSSEKEDDETKFCRDLILTLDRFNSNRIQMVDRIPLLNRFFMNHHLHDIIEVCEDVTQNVTSNDKIDFLRNKIDSRVKIRKIRAYVLDDVEARINYLRDIEKGCERYLRITNWILENILNTEFEDPQGWRVFLDAILRVSQGSNNPSEMEMGRPDR